MVVLKFGGKSLSTKEKVQKICEYIIKRAQNQKIIVVVSAFGDTTNQLIEKFNAYGGSQNNIAEYDMLLSCGETQSAALVCAMLLDMGAKAKAFGAREAEIFAVGPHGSGVITGINKTNITNALESVDIAVVAGFQAVDTSGEIITLGRNGSDTTAVAIASAFSTQVEIYSDFDGVFHGDPRRQNFKKFEKIDYDDAIALANSGSPVLSLQSVQIAKQSATTILAKSSENTNGYGTFVTKVPKSAISICTKDNLSKITINFANNIKNMQKTLEYITKNVNFVDLFAKNNEIKLIIDQKMSKDVEYNIAKINNLLEE